MRIIGAILAAIFGGIFSYFFVGMIAMVVLEAAGASNMEGGLAMGIFFGIAPIGAAIGAVLSAILVLKGSSGSSANQITPSTAQPDGSADDNETVSEFPTPSLSDSHSTTSNTGRDALIVFAILGAVIYGLYAYFLKEESPPPAFASSRAPVVEFEIKAPATAVQKTDDFFSPRLDLRTWYHEFYLGEGSQSKTTDDMVIIKGRAKLRYKHMDRWIKFKPAVSTQVTFKLNYESNPKKEAEFGPWQDAHEFSRSSSSAKQFENADFQIRMRVQ